MSAIKDVLDIVTKISQRTHDRKMAADLLKVQNLVVIIQKDLLQVQEKNLDLMGQNSQLKAQIDSLRRRALQDQRGKMEIESDLPPESEKMLLFFAHACGRDITREQAFSECGAAPGRGDYFFDHLKRRKFISEAGGRVGVGIFYRATPAGREYLFNRGLLD